MNPFVEFLPADGEVFVSAVVDSWPAFVAVLAVAAAVGRQARLERRRPLRRFAHLALPINPWSLPVLIWAFQTSWATWVHLSATRAVGLPIPMSSAILKLQLFEAFAALLFLATLQVAALALVARGRFDLGATGHARVAMIYAVVAVILDGFFLVAMLGDRWPQIRP